MNSDVDLIPNEYRLMRRRVRHLWFGVVALAVIVALCSLSGARLAASARQAEQENEQRRTHAALVAQQTEQLALLDERFAKLEKEVTLLRGLRSGPAAADLFTIVDAALPPGEVWFDDWRMRRAGVLVPERVARDAGGYFLLVADESSERPWQVQTTMTIRGHASDHAALSRFVRGLYDQPRIRDVKLNRTSKAGGTRTGSVGFDLSVVVHSEPVAEG